MINTMNGRCERLCQKIWVPYVFPFALFLLLTESARFFPLFSPYLYIAKTVVVGILLWVWRHRYTQDLAGSLSKRELMGALFCGLLVFVVWIVSEKYLFQFDKDSWFDPYALGETKGALFGLVSVRLIGSSFIVPVMEELFWRSFLMRYLINADFRSVPLGSFTWFSFLGTAFAFGLEHHRVIVGIVAGLIYGLLLIHQKKLMGVIIAHGITNLSLGIYVLLTRSWEFW